MPLCRVNPLSSTRDIWGEYAQKEAIQRSSGFQFLVLLFKFQIYLRLPYLQVDIKSSYRHVIMLL
jgi:hypothetical protein